MVSYLGREQLLTWQKGGGAQEAGAPVKTGWEWAEWDMWAAREVSNSSGGRREGA